MLRTGLVLSIMILSLGGCDTSPLVPWTGDATAPKLVLKDLKNKTRSLADYRNNVVLINFWATWCPPCREEMPSIWRLKNKFRQQKFVVIAVNMGERKEVIEAFLLDELKRDFVVLMDKDQQTNRIWKLLGYPTTYIIDKRGRIKYRYIGPLEWDRAEIVQSISDLLEQ